MHAELSNALKTLREVAVFLRDVSQECDLAHLQHGADVSELAANLREVPRALQGQRITYDARRHPHDPVPAEAVIVNVPEQAGGGAHHEHTVNCFHFPFLSIQASLVCVPSRQPEFCYVIYVPYIDVGVFEPGG